MSRACDDAWWAEARAIAARQRWGGASDAAEDLAQDLAVAAVARLERPDGAPARLGAWLERVCRNAAVDRWRAERRRSALAPELGVPEAPPDPEAALLGRERRRVVRGALAALPREQRRAALLRFHHGLPFAAVARLLGTEEATARTRVHRALARLRQRVRALRVLWFGWQGAQAAVLGLALVAVAEPPPPPRQPPPPARAAAPAGRAAAVQAPSSATAGAAAAPAPPAAHAPRAPEAKAAAATAAPPPVVQRYAFPDDDIDGRYGFPDLEIWPVILPSRQTSLIELRRQLVPELLKSLEDL